MGKYDPEAYEFVLEGLERALQGAAGSLQPAAAGAGAGLMALIMNHAIIEPEEDVYFSLYERGFEMPRVKMRFSLGCWLGFNQLFPVLGGDMIRERGEVMGLSLGDALFLFSPAEVS